MASVLTSFGEMNGSFSQMLRHVQLFVKGIHELSRISNAARKIKTKPVKLATYYDKALTVAADCVVTALFASQSPGCKYLDLAKEFQ